MRPRSMQNVPGLSDIQSPFERFKRFAGMILAVPKEEADKEIKKLRGPAFSKRVALKKEKRIVKGN